LEMRLFFPTAMAHCLFAVRITAAADDDSNNGTQKTPNPNLLYTSLSLSSV